MATPVSAAAINCAALAGRVDEVRGYLDQDGTSCNARSPAGTYPLAAAAQEGHEELVRLLLARGADKEVVDPYGQPALQRAVLKNQGRIVSLLLNSGADATRRNDDGMNALMHASQKGYLDIVKILLEHTKGEGIDVRSSIRGRATALWHACIGNHLEVVKALMLAGADHTLPDSHGNQIWELQGQFMARMEGWRQQYLFKERAAVLHKVRQVHDDLKRSVLRPADRLPAYLTNRAGARMALPSVEIVGTEAEGAEQQEEEAVAAFVFGGLGDELFTELMESMSLGW